MFATLRTYRLIAAFLAVMLLGGNVPLLQHACAMMAQQMGMQHQPCASHDEPHTHHAAEGKHAQHAPQPCDGAQAMQPDCCTVQAQHVEIDAVTVPQRSSKLIAVSALPIADGVAVHHDASWQPQPLLLDTGPPFSAAVSLHILHASFLI